LDKENNPWDSYGVLPESVGMPADKFCSILRSAPFVSGQTKSVDPVVFLNITESNNLISADLVQQMWSKNFAWQYVTPEIGDYNNFMPYPVWNSFVSSADQFTFSCEASEFNYGNTCMGYLETGDFCEIDAQCLSSEKCLGKCCSQWNTDENCGACGETGWCDGCVPGFEFNSTLSLCLELSQVEVGEVCVSDAQCFVSGVCKGNCCNQWMDDVNCGICGDSGWCESCKLGFVWESSTGCVAVDELTQVGFLCDSDSTCSDGGVCKGNCCSQWMNDENCESCNDQGWCAECVQGTVYNLETSKCENVEV